jgi:hypothetical protein
VADRQLKALMDYVNIPHRSLYNTLDTFGRYYELGMAKETQRRDASLLAAGPHLFLDRRNVWRSDREQCAILFVMV